MSVFSCKPEYQLTFGQNIGQSSKMVSLRDTTLFGGKPKANFFGRGNLHHKLYISDSVYHNYLKKVDVRTLVRTRVKPLVD
jgi:hypothetical protein